MKLPLPVRTDSNLLALAQPWRRRGRDVFTVVVKATLQLQPDGDAVVAEETDPLCGDLSVGEIPNSSLLYPSDLALFKPRCDVVLQGHAYPAKRGDSTSFVRFELSRKRKTLFRRQLAVIGARSWEGDVPSSPQPFTKMSLQYEYALGGPEHPINPIGVGLAGDRLPNLEDPENLLRGRGHQAEPAGVSAIPLGWPRRWGKLGSYNERWLKEHFPYFPADFDWTFFQAAPAAQQLDELHGDERFILGGVHPEIPAIVGQLCAPQPRCFARRDSARAPLFEVKLRLDTLVFLPDEMKVSVLWRAVLEDISGVEELLLATDEPDEPAMTLEQAASRWPRVAKPLPAQVTSPADVVANDGSGADAMAAEAGAIQSTLAAAGVSAVAAPSPADEPLPSLSEAQQRERAFARRRLAEDMLARGEDLSTAQLDGADLSGLDLSGQRMLATHLAGARLSGCNLSGADLSGALLAGADLSDAVLDGAVLDLADLSGANLERASLTGASLVQTDMSEVQGTQAVLREVAGTHTILARSDWTRARFDGAKLSAADFIGSRLEAAHFDSAELPDIRLYEAQGERASFAHAMLTDARGDGATLVKATFTEAQAAGSTWDGATLTGANFQRAALAQASFADANCERASFRAADLSEGRLSRAILREAALAGCNLFQALLEGSDLSAADLRGANLYGAETHGAAIDGARLDDANINNTKLQSRS